MRRKNAMNILNKDTGVRVFSDVNTPPYGLTQQGSSAQPADALDMQKLRALEPDTITRVHQMYFLELYRYARYRVNDDSLAEDLTAETFARMLEALHKGKGPKTTLRGYLLGILSNLVTDHFRKAYKRPETSLHDEIPSEKPGPAQQSAQKAEMARVHAALCRLTTEQQHVLGLRFGSEYSLRETAEAMGKSVNAIKVLQFRAIATLRRHLGESHV
jgi:RNA polymerase sigma-70 factor (ECF subfamily)